MEIHADITAGDYRAFQQHAVERASAGAWRPRFGWLVAAWAALAVLFTWLYTATSWAPGYILSCGVGIVIGIVFFYWGSRLQHTDLSPEEGGHLLGPRTFLLEESGVRERSAGSETWVSWAAIRAVAETPEHVFVYLDRGAGLIVPKRAFASTEEAARFIAALRSGGERGL